MLDVEQMLPMTVVDEPTWLAARKALLAKESDLNDARAKVTQARQALPATRVDKEYEFTGPDGPASLRDLFAGQKQLIVYHYMFDPAWSQGCKHCALLVDNIGHLAHLHARDTAVALVSRAPWPKIAAFKERMGWPVPWYSSFGTDFNYDFHATLDEDIAPVEYNFQDQDELVAAGDFSEGEAAGLSVFVTDGDDVLHSYSSYDGEDALYGTFNWLDLTPLGRREGDRSWLRHHDTYDR